MFKLLSIFFALFGFSQCRIYFPQGSDVGYIIPDPPQQLEQDTAQDIPSASLVKEQLLKRQTREQRLLKNEGSLYNDLWYPLPQVKDSENSLTRKLVNDDINKEEALSSLKDEKHGIKMGQSNIHCDDAIHNLLVDWDFSPANYTCYTPRLTRPFKVVQSTETCNIPPKDYMPQHHCMDEHIEYDERIPSFGNHRPLWPQFGEYKFVPPQRWLHNIEHGSVVMLYHPCTRPNLVTELRKLVQGCLYKHIITPYTPLTTERPLALVAWGCVLEMSTVNSTEVISFIKERALKGPEGIMRKQGMFTEGLVTPSVVPEGRTDEDLELCPTLE